MTHRLVGNRVRSPYARALARRRWALCRDWVLVLGGLALLVWLVRH